ncbi:MAG: hypothetical protein ABSH47_05200 [Bryobacteraceae bacterium]|jgi:hypothetical protein
MRIAPSDRLLTRAARFRATTVKEWLCRRIGVAVIAGLLASPGPAEIVDRIAVTIGDRVVTEQQIVHEIRVAAFLNREKPDVSAGAKRDAAERLIKQEVIRREMESTHYPIPEKNEADPLEKQIVEQYGGEATYTAALATYALTREEVREQVWWQLTTLRFIDYRFKPAVHVPETAIESYYRDQVEKWKAQGQKDIPSLEGSRDSIEQVLTAVRVDRALDSWLGEARKQLNIRYRKDAFE